MLCSSPISATKTPSPFGGGGLFITDFCFFRFLFLAESEGFEPSGLLCSPTVLKTAAINHSANFPYKKEP